MAFGFQNDEVHEVADGPLFTEKPTQLICPTCSANVLTTVQKENGSASYMLSFLCLILICPLFWVPLVTNFSKDIVHYCPNCGNEVGSKVLFQSFQ